MVYGTFDVIVRPNKNFDANLISYALVTVLYFIPGNYLPREVLTRYMYRYFTKPLQHFYKM